MENKELDRIHTVPRFQHDLSCLSLQLLGRTDDVDGSIALEVVQRGTDTLSGVTFGGNAFTTSSAQIGLSSPSSQALGSP